MASSPARPARMKARPPFTSGDTTARSPAVEAALARSLFVVPSINGGSLLRRMLPTLRLPPHTVVVLDQGSVDDTEAVCAAAGVRLVQLGRPHTYTEAGNIGARMARELGCDFVFISNNDIAFTTDVGAELLAELLADPHLGIVAPSQFIVDEKAGQRFLAYRAEWHLDTMMFTHDVRALGEDVGRLDADLCELTCAAVRMTAIDEVGFLDDDYGFYYEDADFCFRLRQAGYSCAYLPRSQIEHYTSSTFSAGLSGRKRAYMAKNVELFANKHLGYGVGGLFSPGDAGVSTAGIARHLPRYLRRYGLLSPSRPSLVYGPPGTRPLDYLYMDGEAGAAQDRTAARLQAYRGLVAASEWDRQRLVEAGLDAVGLARTGVELDIFHPWVRPARPFDETTFLWHGHDGCLEGLDVVLEAWSAVRAERSGARLIVVGKGISGCLGHAPASVRRWHNQVISDFPQDGLSLREVVEPFSDEALACLYGSVDVVVSSRSRADPALVAAMACGTLAISGAGSVQDLAFAGALVHGGASETGGSATAWRPDVDALAARLREALAMDAGARRALAGRALPLIRSRFSWRSTCAGLNEALAHWQEPSRIGATLRRRWENDMDLLAGDGTDRIYDAVELPSGHDAAEAEPRAPRALPVQDPSSAAVRPPAPAPSGDPTDTLAADPPPSGRFMRGARRMKRGGRTVVVVWRGEGGHAALGLLRGALSRRIKPRLKSLLVRSGLLPRRR